MSTATIPTVIRHEELHRARTKAGLTQNALAHKCGVPEHIIIKVETLRRKIEPELVLKLSSVLGMNPRKITGVTV